MKLKPEIQEYIEQLKSIRGIYKGYELQLEKLCKELGLKYFAADFDDNISGSIIKDDEGDTYSIYVNKEHPRTRQRFTIAHEIGHYISFLKNSYSKKELEKQGGFEDKAISYRKGGNYSDAEKEASLIAAELLMPKEKIEELINENLIPEEMAKKFFVSSAALVIRLKDLYDDILIV